MPNFDNDIVDISVDTLFEDVSDKIENTKSRQIEDDLSVYKIILGEYSEEVSKFIQAQHDNTKEKKYLSILNIYKILNAQFDIYEKLEGIGAEVWRNIITNSYERSLDKDEDRKNEDFLKGFKEVFAGKFRKKFSEYVEQQEVVLKESWKIERNSKKIRVEDKDPANDNVVEEGGAAAAAVVEEESGAVAVAVNDNTPSASPSSASARLIAKEREISVGKK